MYWTLSGVLYCLDVPAFMSASFSLGGRQWLRQAMANGIFRSTVNIPSTSATLQFCCSLWVEAEQLAHSVVLVVYPEWQ